MEPTQPSIHFEISPEGELTYRVVGVQGTSCKTLTADLDGLGTVTNSGLTEEYHQAPADPLMATQRSESVRQTEVL